MNIMTDSRIRVVLLDDHPMIRFSFEVSASKERDLNVVGSFGRSRELLNWLQHHSADVLVLDYILSSDDMDGLSLIKQILRHHPHLKILLASSMESLAVIRAAFVLGIKGYITKREEAKTYCDAIRITASGQRYIPANLAMELTKLPMRKRDGSVLDLTDTNNEPASRDGVSRLMKLLTAREAEVIHCFLDGMTIIDIAEKLKRSRKTISGHKQTGMKKLGFTSDLELFRYRDELFK